MYRAIQNLILLNRIPDADQLYFNMASNRLNHAYGYRRLPALESLSGSSRMDGILVKWHVS